MGSKSGSGIILILFILLVIVTGTFSSYQRNSDSIDSEANILGSTQGFQIINNTRNHSFIFKATYGERVFPTPSSIIPANGGINHIELPIRAFTTTRSAVVYDVYNDEFATNVGYLQFTLQSFSGITTEILGPQTDTSIKSRKDYGKTYPTLFLTDPV
ncbi:hypothetical protein SAMN05444162_1218 [Paenibacillaceae bacterium GAS479]|nr:hypothetical protein SAMN05444162_1218 [Paenibacillaceae bacterium GAS479]